MSDKRVSCHLVTLLIAAKNETIKETKIKSENSSASHLNDNNLSLTLVNLFIAGNDTTLHALDWSILLMANYPYIEARLREEIATQIGDRIPTQNDKDFCPYFCAFINEVLRFKNMTPI